MVRARKPKPSPDRVPSGVGVAAQGQHIAEHALHDETELTHGAPLHFAGHTQRRDTHEHAAMPTIP